MKTLIFNLTLIALLLIGSPSNVSWLKERAADKWRAQGFEVVDYEGFKWGLGGYGTPYGGAEVWHRLRKVPDNGITYSGHLKRWGNEVHVYGPIAADAIQPQGLGGILGE